MKDVEIYPSSWYYNACVHGFLEVLAWGLGDKGRDIVEEQFLQDDGSVRIPGELMEAVFSTIDVPAPAGYTFREVPDDVKDLKRIAWWWVEKSNKTEDKNPNNMIQSTRLSMFGSNKTFYPNLLPHNEKTPTNKFLNNWFTLTTEGNLKCSFCDGPCEPVQGQKEKVAFFSSAISKHLGSNLDGFPNIYWDSQSNMIMCSLCRSYLLFFHIIHSRRHYVSSDSISLNWYLNNLLQEKSKITRSSQRALLDALRYDTQMRRALGSWGLQNMELVSLEWDDAKVQPISERLANLLLLPRIANLLGLISNSLVWDIVIQERYSYLLNLAYKQLHFFLSGGENKNKDPEIVVGAGKKMAQVTTLLELFYAIRQAEQKEKGGKGLASIDFRQIRKEAEESPISITDNAGKGLVFRLLELTRLNKRTEVYHLLLRTYVAKGLVFPTSLANLFTLNDQELFKTGIYAYIAGLSKENQSQLLTEGGVNDED
ncbi:MAG: hypothetical protein GX176_08155 [Syntrophomonadaceae bacterium]|jgi:CRISPR-associated protein Cst1|nr:hypothetical protein [Syntrophomonadaceae bacterium]HAA08919.1 hypothetical protein [Syntrophomonas sp.]